jgi:hypothetical protein
MDEVPIFLSEENIPREFVGLSFTGSEHHGGGLGTSFSYSSSLGFICTAYLYDLDQTDLPTDLPNLEMEHLLLEAARDTIEVKESRGEVVELIHSGYLGSEGLSGKPFCLVVKFRFCTQEESRKDNKEYWISYLTLRVDRKYFNKIRYTYPERSERIGEQGFLLFLFRWTDYLRNYKPSPSPSIPFDFD